MKNSNCKINYNLSECFKGLSNRWYYVTGWKKYASRHERIKEMPRVREKISLIHRDNLGSDELSVSEMPHRDDVWEEFSKMMSI
jgi:hypothetical protein